MMENKYMYFVPKSPWRILSHMQINIHIQCTSAASFPGSGTLTLKLCRGGIPATYLHSGARETGNEASTCDHCGVCSLIPRPSLSLNCFQYADKEREGPRDLLMGNDATSGSRHVRVMLNKAFINWK